MSLLTTTPQDDLSDSIVSEFATYPSLGRVTSARGMSWKKLSPEYLSSLLGRIDEALLLAMDPEEDFGCPRETSLAVSHLMEWSAEVGAHLDRVTLSGVA